MALYTPLDESRVVDKEFNESLAEDGDSVEEELFLSPSEARWRRGQLSMTWRSRVKKHWSTIALHSVLLFINLLFITLYVTVRPFETSWTVDRVMEESQSISMTPMLWTIPEKGRELTMTARPSQQPYDVRITSL
jgi:hypothetical protein